MSREIIFRAWDNNSKFYVKPEHIEIKAEGCFAVWDEHNGRLAWNGDNAGSQFIIEQWTGLFDSKRTKEYPKGQMIFEGDQYLEGKRLWTVVWATGCFMGDYANGSGQRYINYEDIEICGNIHTEAK